MAKKAETLARVFRRLKRALKVVARLRLVCLMAFQDAAAPVRDFRWALDMRVLFHYKNALTEEALL